MTKGLASGLVAVLLLAPALSCQPVALEGLPCPCATGFLCCHSSQTCRKDVCVDSGAWVTPAAYSPAPMADVTVFAFSQVGTDGRDATGRDQQVLDLAPDLVIRGWAQWKTYGVNRVQYDSSYLDACHSGAQPIRFMGGGTATAFFREQAASEAQFADFVTRDGRGNIVSHDNLNVGEYRASLANPAYRQYLTDVGKIQIDAGVDGLQYSDVNADTQGATLDGNEGFDSYHLADFNAFLLATIGVADARSRFGMTADNRLRDDVPAGDLTANFDYLRYLKARGLADRPFAAENSLAAVWGLSRPGFPQFQSPSFIDNATPYRYWRQIAQDLRDYAQARWGRSLLVSANGIFPFVDFVSYGLYDSADFPSTDFLADVLPAATGHLNGTQVVQLRLVQIKEQAAAFAPGAPVVIYMDGTWNAYHALPKDERIDFWRLYAAEIYANGLFPAFLLKPPDSGPAAGHGGATVSPTATEDGTMDIFRALFGFYKRHADLFHGVTPADPAVRAAVQVSAAPVMVAVTDQQQPPRRLVHVVNHGYAAPSPATGGSGIVRRDGLSVAVLSERPPQSVSLASPDLAGDLPGLAFSYSGGVVTVSVPSLLAYDILILSY